MIRFAQVEDADIVVNYLEQYNKMNNKNVNSNKEKLIQNILSKERVGKILLYHQNDMLIGLSIITFAVSTWLAKPSIHIILLDSLEKDKKIMDSLLQYLIKYKQENDFGRLEVQWDKNDNFMYNYFSNNSFQSLSEWIIVYLDGQDISNLIS